MKLIPKALKRKMNNHASKNPWFWIKGMTMRVNHKPKNHAMVVKPKWKPLENFRRITATLEEEFANSKYRKFQNKTCHIFTCGQPIKLDVCVAYIILHFPDLYLYLDSIFFLNYRMVMKVVQAALRMIRVMMRAKCNTSPLNNSSQISPKTRQITAKLRNT